MAAERQLLRDRVVFLTGGANGIGRDCALAYAVEGAKVVIADIDLSCASSTLKELACEGLALRCDVGDDKSVANAVQATIDRFGKIDAVHNNAGITGPAVPLHETTDADWDLVQRINLKSVYLTTRHAIVSLKKSKGTILNTASAVGMIGQNNHAAYVASKAAMIGLTKAMALDYAREGIRVNAICPAGVWTPMLRQWAGEQPDPASIAKYLDEIHPLGYCPDGNVIADAAVFLLSDQARFITGCILPVTGGAELGYRR